MRVDDSCGGGSLNRSLIRKLIGKSLDLSLMSVIQVKAIINVVASEKKCGSISKRIIQMFCLTK